MMRSPVIHPAHFAMLGPNSLADRENARSSQHARSGQLIRYFEALIAFGYRPGRTDTVIEYLYNHLLRDLPRTLSHPSSPYLPTINADTKARRLTRRTAVTPERVLTSRTPEQLLVVATPEEAAHLEACLPALVDLQGDLLATTNASSKAYGYVRRLRRAVRGMERRLAFSGATSHQLGRLQGLGQLLEDASRDAVLARGEADVARHVFRRALLLPAPRDRRLNRSAQKGRGARRRSPRWWEGVSTRKPVSDLRKGFKAPPRWKDLDDAGLVYMHVAGAYLLGRVITFTLNLTEDVELLARAEADPAAWLRNRIVRRAKQQLGRRVEVLVCLEVNGKDKLHAHGVIAPVTSNEDEAVEDALVLAGGAGYRGEQVKLKGLPDSGWASYLAKDFDEPFPWNRFAATRGLRTCAEQAHEGIRAFVLKHHSQELNKSPAGFDGVSATGSFISDIAEPESAITTDLPLVRAIPTNPVNGSCQNIPASLPSLKPPKSSRDVDLLIDGYRRKCNSSRKGGLARRHPPKWQVRPISSEGWPRSAASRAGSCSVCPAAQTRRRNVISRRDPRSRPFKASRSPLIVQRWGRSPPGESLTPATGAGALRHMRSADKRYPRLAVLAP